MSVSTGGVGGFESIETIHATAAINYPDTEFDQASDGDFGEGAIFEGITLIDWDEILDRNEVAQVLSAHHSMVVYLKVPHDDGAAGQARGQVEFSASPAMQACHALDTTNLDAIEDLDAPGDSDDEDALEFQAITTEDTRDIVGPVLTASMYRGVNDATNGVGIGPTLPQPVTWEGEPPDFLLDDRDELFLNGVFEVDNVASGALNDGWMEVSAYYVVGVDDRDRFQI